MYELGTVTFSIPISKNALGVSYGNHTQEPDKYVESRAVPEVS